MFSYISTPLPQLQYLKIMRNNDDTLHKDLWPHFTDIRLTVGTSALWCIKMTIFWFMMITSLNEGAASGLSSFPFVSCAHHHTGKFLCLIVDYCFTPYQYWQNIISIIQQSTLHGWHNTWINCSLWRNIFGKEEHHT